MGSIEGTYANAMVEVRSSVRFDELCREVIIEDKKGPLHVVFTYMEDAWNHVYHTSVHAATKGQQEAIGIVLRVWGLFGVRLGSIKRPRVPKDKD